MTGIRTFWWVGLLTALLALAVSMAPAHHGCADPDSSERASNGVDPTAAGHSADLKLLALNANTSNTQSRLKVFAGHASARGIIEHPPEFSVPIQRESHIAVVDYHASASRGRSPPNS